MFNFAQIDEQGGIEKKKVTVKDFKKKIVSIVAKLGLNIQVRDSRWIYFTSKRSHDSGLRVDDVRECLPQAQQGNVRFTGEAGAIGFRLME